MMLDTYSAVDCCVDLDGRPPRNRNAYFGTICRVVGATEKKGLPIAEILRMACELTGVWAGTVTVAAPLLGLLALRITSFDGSLSNRREI